MSALGMKLRKGQGGRIMFWCPGCGSAHSVIVDGSRGWTFDGDEVKPTFSPSVLVLYGDHAGAARCHSFVERGQIRFLNDCTHALAGKTVDLPDWPGSTGTGEA